MDNVLGSSVCGLIRRSCVCGFIIGPTTLRVPTGSWAPELRLAIDGGLVVVFRGDTFDCVIDGYPLLGALTSAHVLFAAAGYRDGA